VCEVCSGTILVVEAGVTPENQILECIDKLNVKNVNLIGTVLNDNKNKTLLEELQRETHRLDKYLPNIMIKLRKILSRLVILNVSI
jgi:protein-tyrosine kinase